MRIHCLRWEIDDFLFDAMTVKATTIVVATTITQQRCLFVMVTAATTITNV